VSGPENTFIGSVHRHLPEMKQLYRMKNHNQYNGGIADDWYSGGKADLWIEYKFIVVPKRGDTMVDIAHSATKAGPELSHLQQAWLRGRHREGRSVGVCIGCKAGAVWFPGITWELPLNTDEFVDRIVDRKRFADQIVAMVGLIPAG
jgi:hypothetical protein